MISVDFSSSANAEATVRVLPEEGGSPSVVYLTIEDGSSSLTIFGKPGDVERFEKVAALLNEGFEDRREARVYRPLQTPADLAGDYLGAL